MKRSVCLLVACALLLALLQAVFLSLLPAFPAGGIQLPQLPHDLVQAGAGRWLP